MMISNKEYEKALNNRDYYKIMMDASHSFVGSIPEDEIHRCRLIALWEALKRYDSGRQVRFTSYLYMLVRHQCITFLNNDKKKGCLTFQGDLVSEKDYKDFEMIDALDNLPLELGQIVYERYFLLMKLKEIAKEHNYSIETIRRKIKLAISKLRDIYFPQNL